MSPAMSSTCVAERIVAPDGTRPGSEPSLNIPSNRTSAWPWSSVKIEFDTSSSEARVSCSP